MARKRFQKVRTTDRVLNDVQDRIEEVFNSEPPRIIVESVSLVAGQVNRVAHKLGRKLSGWTLVRIRAQATVWDSQDDNPSPQLTLYLHTSNDVTVDIEVS